MNKILVLDIGGTFIKYALMNKDGEFIEKVKIQTPQYRNDSNSLGALYNYCNIKSYRD